MARKQVKFWLDENKADDLQTEALIADLKRSRLFTRAIREGLKMWAEAQESNETTIKPVNDSGAGDLSEIKAMLEILVTNQKANGGYTMQSLNPLGGPKQIAAPTFAMPNFEDDELPALSVKKDSKTNASLNFMQSLGGLM
jgi:hypothetical protein